MSSRPAMARIYLIHQELSACRYPNVSSLVEHLEYSERTIRRDLEFMRDRLGAPLEYDRQRRGYYYAADYQLPALLLTQEELEAIWVAHQWLRQTKGTPYEQAMQRAWEKLSISFGLGRQSMAECMVVGVAAGVEQAPAPNVHTYRQLEEATQKHQVVCIEYYSPASDTVTNREIEPVLLYLTMGACYCVAFCRLRGGYRTFALNRIRALQVTGEHFQPTSADFNLGDYLEGSIGVMRGDLITLQIRFSHEQARYLDEYPRHTSQKRIAEESSGVIYSFELADNLETLRWVLSFGAAATVLKPVEFAQRIRAELMRTLEKY